MLTKLPRSEFVPPVPAVPATPEVPYRAAYTVCTTPPAPGEWRQVLAEVRIRLDTNTGVQLPPGTVSTRYEKVGGVTYVICTVVRSEWVETGVPGAPVCVTYPAQAYQPAKAAVPAIPARFRSVVDLGWNAGANSGLELDGDVEATFTMPAAVGVVVGFTANRGNVSSRERISHGFYFTQTAAGVAMACAIEAGRKVTAAAPYVPTDQWTIQRIRGAVRYLKNGQRIYASQVPSTGKLSVGTALYATGDTIP